MDEQRLLHAWQKRARKSAACHYRLAVRYSDRNTALTILVITISTAVGSGLFATFPKDGDARWVLGSLSILAGVLAAVQRTTRLSELAERHREAGAGWDKLFNEETLLRYCPQGDTCAQLERYRDDMAALVDKSPHIPQTLFDEHHLTEIYEEVMKPSFDLEADAEQEGGSGEKPAASDERGTTPRDE
jgi:hypothetical protein